LKWLRQLELPTFWQQLRRDLLLEEIETLAKRVRRIEQELNRQARRTSAVEQLRTIPGVGPRTAEAVAAFVDDPQRFPNAKAVGSYFGPVPSRDQSGDRNRLGHITREGAPVVRQLVAEAAWQATGGRRASGPSTSGPGGTTPSGRRSPWWPRPTISCG
jgi:transposase